MMCCLASKCISRSSDRTHLFVQDCIPSLTAGESSQRGRQADRPWLESCSRHLHAGNQPCCFPVCYQLHILRCLKATRNMHLLSQPVMYVFHMPLLCYFRFRAPQCHVHMQVFNVVILLALIERILRPDQITFMDPDTGLLSIRDSDSSLRDKVRESSPHVMCFLSCFM